MGRQAFRRRKADGTIDDGTSAPSVDIGHRVFDKGSSTSNGAHYLSCGNGGFNSLSTGMAWNNTTSYGWRLTPFYSFFGGDVSMASIQVATGVEGCKFEVGIYESDSNGMPTNRIIELSFDCSSSGTKDINVSPNVTLTADKVYWALFARSGGSNSFRMWGQRHHAIMPPAEQRVNYMNIGWYVIGDSTPPSSITHNTISWTSETYLPLITLKIV